MKRSLAPSLIAVLAIACSARSDRAPDQHVALGGEIAARVGNDGISTKAVAAVAAAQAISAESALRKLIDDEIAAASARARAFDRNQPTAWLLRAAHARWTVDAITKEARALGPPTDQELAAVTARHWVEEDRPPTVRVMHAIVLRPKDASLLIAARRLATELQGVLARATDAEFEVKAKEQPHDSKLEVRVERLPDFTSDGRVAEGNGDGRMDTVFAKAAYELPEGGSTSLVVETSFGFHVIRLLERVPEKRTAPESRRAKFADEVVLMREREQKTARLAALRSRTPIKVESAAEQLMRTVKLAPAAQ